MRVCTKCGVNKSLDQFYKRGNKGYRTECKLCHSDAHKARYLASEEKRVSHYHAARKFTLSKYGLSQEDYDRMLHEQGGVCKICQKPETWAVKGRVVNLCVDHCHDTGKVRGLLCRSCNVCLGKMDHDTYLLSRCIRYLEEEL